ncbi:MAG: amidohydrolase family protein, partial [Candidatus Jordarchaeales archaeon]
MRRRRVKKCVVSTFYTHLNCVVKAMVELRPDLFVGFCNVDPREENAGRSLVRLIRLEGFRGLKLHPLHQKFRPQDALNVWEAASKLRIPVLVHAGKIWKSDPDYADPSHFHEVLDRYQGFTLILAHMGGNYVRESVELARRFDNVFMDTSGASARRIMYSLERLGAERILYGSDSPFIPMGDPLPEIEKVKSLPISEREKEMILGENAMRILEVHL